MREGLKQRLVGGFVLAALAVIFLPGLFKEQQGHRVDSESRIPPPPLAQTVTFAEPDSSWQGETAPDPQTMFLPDDEPSTSLPSPMPVATGSSVVAPASPAAASASSASVSSVSSLAPVPAIPLDDKGIPQAWMVQLVSLSNRQTAIKLRDELQSDGYKAFIREARTDKGTFTRVLVGPNLNRDEAVKIKTELDQRLKINARISRFEP